MYEGPYTQTSSELYTTSSVAISSLQQIDLMEIMHTEMPESGLIKNDGPSK